jgi:glycosyltransferase involved in cell wall biosynthesis
MHGISIAVAVYNEEESLPFLCEKLHAVMSGLGKTYEIVLVDDGSTDTSWKVMNEQAGKYPNLKLVKFRRNYGQTAAMSAGINESDGAVLITLDADLQNDPADIPALLAKLDEGYDVVSGWRKDRQDAFINRKLPSMIANKLIGKLTGVHLHDYGCSLKAYRREIISDVRLYGEMHRFIPALCRWAGGTVTEMPVSHHARKYGKSKYGISRTMRVVLDLMTVKFLLSYSTRPIQVFGKIGIYFGVLAASILGVVGLEAILGATGAISVPWWASLRSSPPERTMNRRTNRYTILNPSWNPP